MAVKIFNRSKPRSPEAAIEADQQRTKESAPLPTKHHVASPTRRTMATFGTARAPPDEKPPLRLLCWRDLPSKGIYFHRNTIRRMWNEGKFPVPTKVSERKLAWSEAAIDAWIISKLAEVET